MLLEYEQLCMDGFGFETLYNLCPIAGRCLAMSGRHHSLATRTKMSDAAKNKTHSPEHNAKISATRKSKIANGEIDMHQLCVLANSPEGRLKRSIKRKEDMASGKFVLKTNTPEANAKRAATYKKKVASGEIVLKLHTPEANAKRVATKKKNREGHA